MIKMSKEADDLPLGEYQHYKGGRYDVLGVGMHENSHEELVIYQDQKTEHVWLRPLAQFTEKVDVDGKMLHRFRFLDA